MDYLGKGEALTNTDLDRFVNNILEVHRLQFSRPIPIVIAFDRF